MARLKEDNGIYICMQANKTDAEIVNQKPKMLEP